MVIAYVPAIFAIAGVLTYALTEGKLSEAGRLVFFAGMLALALALGNVGIHLHG